MTSIDIGSLTSRHTSEEAARRTRRRHRAEWRLKAYGIAAIMLAAAALAVLVWTIAGRTVGVVYEYYLTLETTVEIDDDDRERIEDPNPRLLPSLNGPVKDALYAAVPGDPDRSARRELGQLLSSDAGLELGKMVKADPDLAGQTIRFQALLDDEVQMYLKGSLGELERVGGQGAVEPTVTGEGDDATLTLSLPEGSFAAARQALSTARLADAMLARAEAARQSNAVAAFDERLREAETDAEREEIRQRLDGYVAARDAAVEKAENLNRKATTEGSVFTLALDDPSVLVRLNGGWIKATELGPDSLTGIPLLPLTSDAVAGAGEWEGYVFNRPEAARNVSDRQIAWLEEFQRAGQIEQALNTRLLTSSDSSNAELAGIWGALVGSFWTMMVTFGIAFPVGVLASIYLEEFAPRNRLTDFIEVNINNLAAVPSIVFGLLGLAIFVSGLEFDVFGVTLQIGGFLPRSSPVAGGVVLALMTLPTIIIAGRASIRAVPPSIREAALGLGASRLQTSTHHVLPLAMPGIMTGAIIGMAQALGETAPLLLVGMNSFIQEPPSMPLDPANVLPTLIYQWNNNSERLFDDKTAAAISVLLVFLVAMNALAVLLRKRFERRW